MSSVDSEGELILLVDDNPTNLQVLYGTLDGRGYQLRIAQSGEDAIDIARAATPQLILLDIMMPPGIDGFETLGRLKADPVTSGIPVIFLSALDETEVKVKGLTLGAVDFVNKPFQAEEVIARVSTHLTLHRLQRELEVRNEELVTANQRMKRDLEAAARVQAALLPDSLPDTARVQFAWRYRPCDELAGDALGVQGIAEDQVALYIVDVSGHGVPSSLLSVAVTRSLAPAGDVTQARTPAQIAARLNTLYPMADNGNHYFTMVYGTLDPGTGVFRYTAAGHPGPLVVTGTQPPSSHDLPAVPIGLLDDAEYEEAELVLKPGDRVYLYSDGLNEERNSEGEQFGRRRLEAALAARFEQPLAEGIDAVLSELASWRGDDRFSDDLSIVAAEMLHP